MDIVFTVHRDKFLDYDGTEIGEFNDKFVSPLEFNSTCYILYQNWFGRWQIREELVKAICYTNMWLYKMSNGWCIDANNLGKTLFLHGELSKAKEECLERNRTRKVKVKYLRG